MRVVTHHDSHHTDMISSHFPHITHTNNEYKTRKNDVQCIADVQKMERGEKNEFCETEFEKCKRSLKCTLFDLRFCCVFVSTFTLSQLCGKVTCTCCLFVVVFHIYNQLSIHPGVEVYHCRILLH